MKIASFTQDEVIARLSELAGTSVFLSCWRGYVAGTLEREEHTKNYWHVVCPGARISFTTKDIAYISDEMNKHNEYTISLRIQ